MSVWALVINGSVAQIETVDPTGRFVAAWPCPDVSALDPQPQVGWTATETGGVWSFTALPAPPTPTLAQQAAAALLAGCQIVSTGTPDLSGTYPCDAIAQQRITSIQTRINAGLGLPLGASTIDWLDTSYTPHSFTAAQFTLMAAAISDYAYSLELLTMGQGTVLPGQPSTIT